MFDSFSLTDFIGLMFGIYLIAAAIGLFFDGDSYQKVMDEFIASPALCYLGGIAAFSLGAVIIWVHNIWGSPIEIFISLIGWMAMIEGVLILAFRPIVFGLVGRMPLSGNVLKGFGVAIVILGCALIYCAVS